MICWTREHEANEVNYPFFRMYGTWLSDDKKNIEEKTNKDGEIMKEYDTKRKIS